MTLFTTHNLCCPSFMATHMCVCSEKYVAVPLNERGNVAVWKTENLLEKPTTLIGHHKVVTALDLSPSPIDHFLCTCSSDNIIIWNLLENGGNPTKGKVLHSHMEQPLFCCFSSDTSKIAFSFPNGMWIFNLKKNSWFISIEECHFTIFDYANNNKILGIEDIYLKLWDLKINEVTKNQSITPGLPSTLCTNTKSGIILVGTTCGHLNVYGQNYNLIKSIQVWKLLSQYQNFDSKDEGSCKDYNSDSFPIFSIQSFTVTDDPGVRPENFLPQIIYSFIVTSTCIFIINISNEDIVFYLDFNDDFDNVRENTRIGLVRFASIVCFSDSSVAYINVIPVMGESLVLIKLFLKEIEVAHKDKLTKLKTDSQRKSFTFLNSVSERHDKSLLSSKVQNSAKKILKKASSNLNLPVTFHSNIKSSGYGTLHKNIFKENISPAHFEKLVCLDKIKTFENPMMSCLQISVDGKYSSITSSDGSIDILKLGKKQIKMFHTINAHKGQVKSAKWSHSEKLLVSGSRDKTIKIWNLEKHQPLLTIGLNKDNITGTTKSKFVFEDAIEQVQFYYLDHLILAATGNSVCLFEYTINIEKSGLRNFVNKSSAKLLKKIPLSMKRITSLAAMNQFFSNIVLCAGSSKCIDVLDMTVGNVVAHMEDASSKPPFLISLNEGSPYSSHVPAMYDLFLTASQFDGIKIWDLRTNRHVLNYKEHKCRLYPCDANFSPSGKYIATGSEDKSVYIYDLRQLTHLHRLSDQQTDVFTSVAFTPQSQLLTSSLNGLIHFYGEID